MPDGHNDKFILFRLLELNFNILLCIVIKLFSILIVTLIEWNN